MDPQQELFSALLVALRETGYDVYDGALPPEDTPYPFVYLGDNEQSDEDTKNKVIGRVTQTIHVWHNNPQRRGEVSAMMLTAKSVCRSIGRTAHFGWFVRSCQQRIITDNTTTTPLMHGVLTVSFQFS